MLQHFPVHWASGYSFLTSLGRTCCCCSTRGLACWAAARRGLPRAELHGMSHLRRLLRAAASGALGARKKRAPQSRWN